MRPNILYIMTDQQSYKMLSSGGNNFLKTPALDFLANNGVTFNRAYCTDPVCVPSRFSLFTGKMPGYINLKSNDADNIDYDRVLELKKQGIGYLFKQAGYEAVYGGKQHLPNFTAKDLGFDILTYDERQTLADKASEYIKEDRDKPFFLVASLINPHDICYMAIKDFLDSEASKHLIKNANVEVNNVDNILNSYDDNKIDMLPPLPENHMPQADEPEAIDKLISSRSFRKKARENYSNKQWRLHRYLYHRLTEMVDKKIGIILDALKESGKEESTVVIFTSDHGDNDASHKLEHKTVFYDEAAKIPLIVYQKNKTLKGYVDNDNLISNGLDLIPSICDYANIDVPENLEGKSFKPLVENKAMLSKREYVKCESEIGQMIVTKNYKYAKFFEGENKIQLYDLKNDPHEMRNAYFDKNNLEIIKHHENLFSQAFS